MQCFQCEIEHKCKNKPQSECVDYNLFSSGGVKELPNAEQKKALAARGVEVDEYGIVKLNDNFSMGECHFCHRVDHTLMYQYLGENIYCCNECKEKMVANNDDATMKLIDMIFAAEKFAKYERVERGIESIVCVFAGAIRKFMMGDTKPLLDMCNITQAVGTKAGVVELIDSGLLNKKELDYLKADIEAQGDRIEYEQSLKLTDESGDDDD